MATALRPIELREEAPRSLDLRFAAVFVSIAIIIVAVRFRWPPWQFADYPTYLYLLDGYRIPGGPSLISSEPLSWGVLILFRSLTGTTAAAVNLGNWYTSAWFLAGIYVLHRSYKVPWQGLAIIGAVYGGLLAFVTIRATPAYFLVTAAAFELSRNRVRAVVLTLSAGLFHSSAALAIAPVVAAATFGQFPAVRAAVSSRTLILAIGIVVTLPFVLLSDPLTDLVRTLISTIPALARFAVYLNTDASQQAVTNSGQFHKIYLAVCAATVAGSLVLARNIAYEMRVFLVFSFAIFIFLQFSPVSAYRYSLYFMMPALLSIDWHRYRLYGIGSTLIVGGSLALFALTLPNILVR